VWWNSDGWLNECLPRATEELHTSHLPISKPRTEVKRPGSCRRHEEGRLSLDGDKNRLERIKAFHSKGVSDV